MKLRDIKSGILFRSGAWLVMIAFTITLIMPPQVASAQVSSPAMLNLPVPGTLVPATPPYNPAIIRGLTIYPNNPFEFDFIVGTGDDNLQGEVLNGESTKLIKYFLASLTVPEEQMWVNLSPYEENRIIPDEFGQTEMGRDLLVQDYLLKQLSASLMYPEDDLGKAFWARVYKRAHQQYGSTEIPLNTFNKIWIVPEKADVYIKDNSVFVVNSHLKVMLEEDYLALEMNQGSTKHGLGETKEEAIDIMTGVTADVVREILIPEIEHEINHGKTFANLRQIYHSMILATWYKKNLKESLLGKTYVNQAKTEGVDILDPEVNQRIYDQYVKSFKKGVYNYIREERDPITDELRPRKYFSGGVDQTAIDQAMMTVAAPDITASADLYGNNVRVHTRLNDAGADAAMTATADPSSEDQAIPVSSLAEVLANRERAKKKLLDDDEGYQHRHKEYIETSENRDPLEVTIKEDLQILDPETFGFALDPDLPDGFSNSFHHTLMKISDNVFVFHAHLKANFNKEYDPSGKGSLGEKGGDGLFILFEQVRGQFKVHHIFISPDLGNYVLPAISLNSLVEEDVENRAFWQEMYSALEASATKYFNEDIKQNIENAISTNKIQHFLGQSIFGKGKNRLFEFITKRVAATQDEDGIVQDRERGIYYEIVYSLDQIDADEAMTATADIPSVDQAIVVKLNKTAVANARAEWEKGIAHFAGLMAGMFNFGPYEEIYIHYRKSNGENLRLTLEEAAEQDIQPNINRQGISLDFADGRYVRIRIKNYGIDVYVFDESDSMPTSAIKANIKQQFTDADMAQLVGLDQRRELFSYSSQKLSAALVSGILCFGSGCSTTLIKDTESQTDEWDQITVPIDITVERLRTLVGQYYGVLDEYVGLVEAGKMTQEKGEQIQTRSTAILDAILQMPGIEVSNTDELKAYLESQGYYFVPVLQQGVQKGDVFIGNVFAFNFHRILDSHVVTEQIGNQSIEYTEYVLSPHLFDIPSFVGENSETATATEVSLMPGGYAPFFEHTYAQYLKYRDEGVLERAYRPLPVGEQSLARANFRIFARQWGDPLAFTVEEIDAQHVDHMRLHGQQHVADKQALIAGSLDFDVAEDLHSAFLESNVLLEQRVFMRQFLEQSLPYYTLAEIVNNYRKFRWSGESSSYTLAADRLFRGLAHAAYQDQEIRNRYVQIETERKGAELSEQETHRFLNLLQAGGAWVFGIENLTPEEIYRLALRVAYQDESFADMLTPEQIKEAEELVLPDEDVATSTSDAAMFGRNSGSQRLRRAREFVHALGDFAGALKDYVKSHPRVHHTIASAVLLGLVSLPYTGYMVYDEVQEKKAAFVSIVQDHPYAELTLRLDAPLSLRMPDLSDRPVNVALSDANSALQIKESTTSVYAGEDSEGNAIYEDEFDYYYALPGDAIAYLAEANVLIDDLKEIRGIYYGEDYFDRLEPVQVGSTELQAIIPQNGGGRYVTSRVEFVRNDIFAEYRDQIEPLQVTVREVAATVKEEVSPYVWEDLNKYSFKTMIPKFTLIAGQLLLWLGFSGSKNFRRANLDYAGALARKFMDSFKGSKEEDQAMTAMAAGATFNKTPEGIKVRDLFRGDDPLRGRFLRHLFSQRGIAMSEFDASTGVSHSARSRAFDGLPVSGQSAMGILRALKVSGDTDMEIVINFEKQYIAWKERTDPNYLTNYSKLEDLFSNKGPRRNAAAAFLYETLRESGKTIRQFAQELDRDYIHLGRVLRGANTTTDTILSVIVALDFGKTEDEAIKVYLERLAAWQQFKEPLKFKTSAHIFDGRNKQREEFLASFRLNLGYSVKMAAQVGKISADKVNQIEKGTRTVLPEEGFKHLKALGFGDTYAEILTHYNLRYELWLAGERAKATAPFNRDHLAQIAPDFSPDSLFKKLYSKKLLELFGSESIARGMYWTGIINEELILADFVTGTGLTETDVVRLQQGEGMAPEKAARLLRRYYLTEDLYEALYGRNNTAGYLEEWEQWMQDNGYVDAAMTTTEDRPAPDNAMYSDLDHYKVNMAKRSLERLKGKYDISDRASTFAMLKPDYVEVLQTLAAAGEFGLLANVLENAADYDSFIVNQSLIVLAQHAAKLDPETEQLIIGKVRQFLSDSNSSDGLIELAVEIIPRINKAGIVRSLEGLLLDVVKDKARPSRLRVDTVRVLIKFDVYGGIIRMLEHMFAQQEVPFPESKGAGEILKTVLDISDKRLLMVANGQARINAIKSVVDFLEMDPEDMAIGYEQSKDSDGSIRQLLNATFPGSQTIAMRDTREYDHDAYIRIEFVDDAPDVTHNPLKGWLRLEAVKGHVPYVSPEEIASIRAQMNIGDRPVIVVGSPGTLEMSPILRGLMELTEGMTDEIQKPLLIIGFREPGDAYRLAMLREEMVVKERTQADKDAGRPFEDLATADILSVTSVGELGTLYALARDNGVGIVGHDRNIMELAMQGIAFVYMRGAWTLNKQVLDAFVAADAVRAYSPTALSEILSNAEMRRTLAAKALQTGQSLEQGIRQEVANLGLLLSVFALDTMTQDLDSAMMSAPGGIDLNPEALELNEQGETIQMKIPLQDTNYQNININGLVPVIINVTPVPSLPLLLGLDEQKDDIDFSHTPELDPADRKARLEWKKFEEESLLN